MSSIIRNFKSLSGWRKYPLIFLVFFIVLNVAVSFKKLHLHDAWPLGYGAYGLVLANYENHPEEEDVIFLGNSVHAGYQIVELIQKRFDDANLPVQFANFSHGGASVADYITHYRHIRQFNPDLLVIAFNPSSLGQAWPYFRNDSYKAILHPNYISLLKEKSIRKLFNKGMYAESFWYSYFPIFRWVQVASIQATRSLGIYFRDAKVTKLRIWSFFQIRASLAFDMLMRREEGKKANEVVPLLNENEYENAEELLEVLIAELAADNQKTLWLIQPNSMPAGPVINNIQNMLENVPNFYFVDDSKFWDKTKYNDDVHPNKLGADEDTLRQFHLIKKLLGIN